VPAPYNVEIKGFRQLAKLFDVLIRDMSTKRVMSRIGNFAMTKIKDRTSEGKDVDMSPFVAYSAGHAKVRAAKGLPTNVVDLFFHGTMMNAMTFKATDDTVRLYFLPTAGKTAQGKPASIRSPEKAYYLNEQREFFALSDKEMNEAREIALREIDQLLKEK
jgi:hypothetical protein